MLAVAPPMVHRRDMTSDADHETLDAYAFAAACEAAPDVHPDKVRRIVDAYTGEAHIRVREVHESEPLSAEQLLDAFRPRTVEF